MNRVAANDLGPAPSAEAETYERLCQLESENRLLREALQQSHHLRRQWLGTIEELRHTRRELEDAQALLQGILDAIPVGVFWKDANGALLGCNRQFAADVGLADPVVVIGKTELDLFDPEHARAWRAEDTRILNAEAGIIRGRETQVRAGGREFWVRASRMPLLGVDGEVTGVLGCHENVDDYKRAVAETLNAKASLESANRAKSQFLATMSHELRTPLNAILGFSEIIRDQILGPIGSPQYSEYAEDIHASGEYLLKLINDILDISKIEAGRLDVDPTWLDLRPLIGGAVRLVGHRARIQNLSLEIAVADRLSGLWADERAVKQILFNLLSNAIKFTPAGGSIRICAEERDDRRVVLSVTDTGVGIPAGQIGRLFQPFEQLDNRYARAGGGTGLGLALVKGLAELHGGTAEIESEVGVGTTIRVLFPGPPSAIGGPHPES